MVKSSGSIGLSSYYQKNAPNILKHAFVHGALLFRGFDVSSPVEFQRSLSCLDLLPANMSGSAAPRTQLSELVFTSNDSPPDSKIPMHHEMAQTRNPPSHIMFFCETPAATGGETPIVDSREIARFVKKNHIDVFEKLKGGVCYSRFMTAHDDPSSPLGRGWKNTFNVDTPNELETVLRESKTLFEWNGEILKTTTRPMPAIVTQSCYELSYECFFNSIIAAYTGWNDKYNVGPRAVTYADGSYIPVEFVDSLQTFVEAQKVAFRWRRGDVLLIDNRVTMHSRNPFTGPRCLFTCIGNQT